MQLFPVRHVKIDPTQIKYNYWLLLDYVCMCVYVGEKDWSKLKYTIQ